MLGYVINEKMIGIRKSFYSTSRCVVRADGQVGEWFNIVTEVRQGRVHRHFYSCWQWTEFYVMQQTVTQME